MSLINDALKRASAASKNAPANPTVSIRLQPADEEGRPGMLFMVGLPLLIVAVLLAGGWYYYYGRHAGTPVVAQTAIPAAASKPAAAQTPVATPPVATAPATAAAVVPPAIKEAPPVNVSNATVAVKPLAVKKTADAPNAATAKTPVVFPPLKLQGIYYRRTNPTTMINNQNVGVGESVDGVTIIAIERMFVTVEFDGHKKVLNLQ